MSGTTHLGYAHITLHDGVLHIDRYIPVKIKVYNVRFSAGQAAAYFYEASPGAGRIALCLEGVTQALVFTCTYSFRTQAHSTPARSLLSLVGVAQRAGLLDAYEDWRTLELKV